MKVGLALPYNQTKLVPEAARLAEETGWDGRFLGDAIWCEDPMIALASAAMTTKRIRLGFMLIPVPLRKPWKIASEAIAVELLSNGRRTLGMGIGDDAGDDENDKAIDRPQQQGQEFPGKPATLRPDGLSSHPYSPSYSTYRRTL